MPYLFSENIKNIVIAHPSRKEYYLREKNANPYLDLTVMTLPEMKALFDYNYDDRALRFLLGKGYKYLIAKDLLAAFCAPNFDKGVEVKKYADLRDELIKEHLLFKTAYPERTFIGSHILISGYYREAQTIFEYLKNVPAMLQTDYEVEERKDPSEKVVNKFIDPYEELHFVYNKIAHDIEVKKTPISNIYVYGLSSDYVPLINEFNKMYGFTIDLRLRERLFDKPVYKLFRKVFEEEGLEKAITSMREKYPDSKDADNIERFAREFAVVFEKEPAKTLSIYDDIAKEKAPYVVKRKNVIQVLDEPVCPPNGHLYCLNFSMGTYPSVKDESGLFNDKEKELIGLVSSKEMSLNDSERVDQLLHRDSLKLLTFFELGFESHHFLSGFVDKYGMSIVDSPVAEDENGPYEYAHDKGGFLYAALEDEYRNYLTDDKRRAAYEKVSELDGYRKYDNSYKGTKAKGKNRSYSASKLTNYRSCPFKYLLDNVLHLDDSPSQFSARIGNIFHKTLEMYHSEKSFDFDKAYDLAVAYEQGLRQDPNDNFHEEKVPFTEKEKAIIENLRQYCLKSLKFQQSYEANLKNPKYFPEGEFNINLDGMNINGRYDKIITFDYSGDRYAFIIDYKSGGTKFEEALFQSEAGLSLQLPLYALALEKNASDFDNAKIAGMFISPVLAYGLTKSEKELKKTMDEIDQNKTRLMGLYLNNIPLLRSVEPGLTSGSSKVFDGCEVKKDVDAFIQRSEYPRNKTSEEFHALAERAEEIIRESDEAITKGKFEINPTVIKSKHDACKNCSFHDVCFIDKNTIVAKTLSKPNMNPDLDDGDDEENEEEEES